MEAKIERAWVEVLPDPDPDTSYLEQDDPDFSERLAQFRAGAFSFVGVRACAEIRFQTEQGGWILGPIVATPGLWGIGDDSGEQYLREIGAEEANQLPDMLESLGIGAARARYAALIAKTDLQYK